MATTVVLVIVAIGVVVLHSTTGAGSTAYPQAKASPGVQAVQDSYADVLRAADSGRVESLTLDDGTGKADVVFSDGRYATATIPAEDEGLLLSLADSGTDVTVDGTT